MSAKFHLGTWSRTVWKATGNRSGDIWHKTLQPQWRLCCERSHRHSTSFDKYDLKNFRI